MHQISLGYALLFDSLIVVLQLCADLLQINRCVQWAVAVCMDNSCFLACPIILTSLRHFLLVGTFSELNEVLSWSYADIGLDNIFFSRCYSNIVIWEHNLISCIIHAKAQYICSWDVLPATTILRQMQMCNSTEWCFDVNLMTSKPAIHSTPSVPK
jgi:hypothetical protein